MSVDDTLDSGISPSFLCTRFWCSGCFLDSEGALRIPSPQVLALVEAPALVEDPSAIL